MIEKRQPNWAEYVEAVLPAVFDLVDYEPSPEQWAVHRDNSRVRLVAGGIRAGKSFLSAMDLVARASYMTYLGNIGTQLYWILGPDYEQARAEFTYIEDAFVNCGFTFEGKPSKPEGKSAGWTMRIREVGTVMTKTSSDETKIASFPPDGIIMAEAAQQTHSAYLAARARVVEKRGWLILSGTFEGSLGWYPDAYTAWQKGVNNSKSFSLPTWSNLKVFPGGRDDEEIKQIEAMMPADLFQERFGAVPYKPHTLIFRDFNYVEHVDERIVYKPGQEVWIAVDPGYDPGYYHVSAFQFHGTPGGKEEAWQVDEIHVQRMTAPEVIEMAMDREWWKDVSAGVIDVAGTHHHAQKSHVEIWLEKTSIYLWSNYVGVLDGIERHRTMLMDPETKKPRLYHNPNNVHTIKEYSLYQRRPDKETQNLSAKPLDRNNHAMKSIAYLLMERYGPVEPVFHKSGKIATL